MSSDDYINRTTKFRDDCAHQWDLSGITDHAGPTNAAEDAVTGPMIDALDAHAAEQTPPWTR